MQGGRYVCYHSVVVESPCGQVDSLLVSRLLRPRQKVLNKDTDFHLDLNKIMNRREGKRCVPYERCVSLQSPCRASILSSLIGPSKQTNIQWTSYSIEIISIIDPSTADKLIWNKYKFERNTPSIDYINENK
jgi:hypothetical protein